MQQVRSYLLGGYSEDKFDRWCDLQNVRLAGSLCVLERRGKEMVDASGGRENAPTERNAVWHFVFPIIQNGIQKPCSKNEPGGKRTFRSSSKWEIGIILYIQLHGWIL